MRSFIYAALALVASLSIATAGKTAVLYDAGDGTQPALALGQSYAGGTVLAFDSAFTISGVSGQFQALVPNSHVSVAVWDFTTRQRLFSTAAFTLADAVSWQGVSGLSWALGAGVYIVGFESPDAYPGARLWGLSPTAYPASDYMVWAGGTWSRAPLATFALRVDGEGSPAVLADVISDPIPEPGAWALMIIGFGAAGSALRLRRHKLA